MAKDRTIEHIRDRIAAIKERLATDPEFADMVADRFADAEDSARRYAADARERRRRLAANVTPIRKPIHVRRSDGEVIDL